ncbi:MAG: Ku protein, partial [Mesorhizobium sp.]
MAPRPAWKGYLKLSLVTCAIELTNVVTHAEKVSFRILNRKTGNTVKRIYVDSETGKPLEEGDEIKGYEVSDGDFVHIEEDEIEAVQIESSHTMSLDGFVEKSSIEQIYLDTPYYVSPADEVSEEAFAVIRDAMAAKKMAGLARIVLYQRERPVVLEPLGKGMVLTTLRYDDT